MHFHDEKDETWLVLEGKFNLTYIDTKDASQHTKVLEEGDTWRNFPLEPHQLTCLAEGVIVEVSTADSAEDNYRILPGDSQNL
jgi:quercetin dioxygenase-like cupin family protein